MKNVDYKKWVSLFTLIFTYIFLIVYSPVNKYPVWHFFKITAYCPGSCCNDQWAGMTASNKSMDYYFKRNINICAVDPKVIPLGSKIFYNGKEYLCADTGGAIKGYHLDILLKTHAETVIFGVKKNQIVFKQRRL